MITKINWFVNITQTRQTYGGQAEELAVFC